MRRANTQRLFIAGRLYSDRRSAGVEFRAKSTLRWDTRFYRSDTPRTSVHLSRHSVTGPMAFQRLSDSLLVGGGMRPGGAGWAAAAAFSERGELGLLW